MNEILIGLECFEREFDCFFLGCMGELPCILLVKVSMVRIV